MRDAIRTSTLVSGATTIAICVFGLLIFGLPLAFDIETALRTSSDVFSSPFAIFFKPTAASFVSAATRSGLPTAAWASVQITGGVVLIVMVVALPTAYALARATGMLRSAGMAAIIVLQLLPATVLVIPLFQVLVTLRLLGGIPGVVVASAAYQVPFVVILLRPFFLSVPVEIEEAASVDGSGRLRTFLQVTLPITRNGVLVVTVLVAMISWGDFIYPISFLTNPQDFPLSALLASQISQLNANWAQLMALMLIVLSPIIVVFVLMERQLASGLSIGAVK